VTTQPPSAELSQVALGLASITAPLREQLAGLRNGAAAAAALLSIGEAARVNDSLVSSASRILGASAVAGLKTQYSSILDANRHFSAILGSSVAQGLMASDAVNALVQTKGIAAGLALDRLAMSSFLKIESSRALAASLMAQETSFALRGQPVGVLIGADSTFRRSTAAHLGLVTRSYEALMAATAVTAVVPSDMLLATTSVPVDYFRHVQTVESVTLSESGASSSEVAEAVVDSASPPVDELLAALDSTLVPLLTGARQAVRGVNADRPRHVTTSLRELFTQVLHSLAPDDAVAAWSSDRDDFANGRPTRRARLMYVCREINSGPLVDFVRKDVSAALSFVDSLSAGTHTVQSRLTDAQLRAQLARMESLISLLLQVAPQA